MSCVTSEDLISQVYSELYTFYNSASYPGSFHGLTQFQKGVKSYKLSQKRCLACSAVLTKISKEAILQGEGVGVERGKMLLPVNHRKVAKLNRNTHLT